MKKEEQEEKERERYKYDSRLVQCEKCKMTHQIRKLIDDSCDMKNAR